MNPRVFLLCWLADIAETLRLRKLARWLDAHIQRIYDRRQA